MPKIQYIDPESEQMISVDINANMPVVTIGRNPGNVIRVNNPSISRQHAKIVWDEESCKLVDLDSSNGSYINGQQVKSQILLANDRIRIGEFPLDYIPDMDSPVADSPAEAFAQAFAPRGESKVESLDPAEKPLASSFDNPSPIEDLLDVPSLVNDDHIFGEPSSVEKSSSEAVSSLFPAPNDHPNDSMNAISFLDSEFNDSLALPDVSIANQSELSEASEPEIIEEVLIIPPANLNFPIEEALEESISEPSIAPTPEPEIAFEPAPEPAPEPPVEPAPVEPAPAETPMEIISEAPASEAVAIENPDFEARIKELTDERDEMLDLLQSLAGDAGGAAKVQIDRLRNERDRLIEERRNLQRSQRKLQSELSALPSSEIIKEMESELKTLRTKDETHEKRVDDLQKEINKQASQIETSQQVLATKDAKILDLSTLIDADADLAGSLTKSNHQIETLNETLSEKELNISSLNTELENAKNEKNELVDRIQNLEAQNQASQESIDELQQENKTLSVKAEELVVLTEKHASTTAELASRKSPKEVEDLVRHLEEATNKVESQSKTIDELSHAKSELEEKLSIADKAQSEFDSRFNKQTATLTEIRNDFQDLKTEKEAFARETDYLMGAKRNFDSEIRSHQKRVQELEKADRRKKKIFEELRTDIQALVDENTLLQSNLSSLKNELADAPSREELDSARSSSADLSEEIAGLKQSINDFENTIGTTSKDLEKEIQMRTNVESKHKEALIELDALRQVVSDTSHTSEALDALVKDMKTAKKDLKSLAKKLDKSESEKAKLTNQLADLKESNKKLKKEMTSHNKKGDEKSSKLESKMKNLESQLRDAEDALSEIILEKDKLEDQLKAKG